MKHRIIRSCVAVALLAAGLSGAAANAKASCASAKGGGDWSQHGGDVSGTRSQPLEKTISTANVTNLASKWTFDVVKEGGTGNIETIPIESNGCVYVQTAQGWLFALNADTGTLVWKVKHEAGASTNAPAVHDGVIYSVVPSKVNASADHKGIHVVALDALTGTLVWDGDTIAPEAGASAVAGATASAVFFDGMIFVGLTNDEMTPTRLGGFGLVDARDGSLIHREYNVPDDEAARGFAGCSLWSTAAVDPITKQAFVGTGQPAGWMDKESERCDAIVKIDLDRASATFGHIVGALKGIPDDPPYADVDFGSAPSLLHDADGRQVVAQLQKAGYVTAGYTRHMTLAWRTQISPIGAALGNYTASATDGLNIFTVGAYPGQMFSLSGTTGLPNWVTPVPSPIATNSVAYANGVVYYATEAGVLLALDSSNGVPLYAHPIILDAPPAIAAGPPPSTSGGCTRAQGGGVSVARNRIFAACGPVVASFGL